MTKDINTALAWRLGEMYTQEYHAKHTKQQMIDTDGLVMPLYVLGKLLLALLSSDQQNQLQLHKKS